MSNESRTIPRRRLGAGSAMVHLASSAGLNRAKKAQQAGHTGLWQRHWGWGMAKTHIEQVLRRRVENSGTVSESWLDVGQSTTAVGRVTCWCAARREGHGVQSDRNYDELLPPEPTRPPQLPLRENLTLVASVSSGLLG